MPRALFICRNQACRICQIHLNSTFVTLDFLDLGLVRDLTAESYYTYIHIYIYNHIIHTYIYIYTYTYAQVHRIYVYGTYTHITCDMCHNIYITREIALCIIMCVCVPNIAIICVYIYILLHHFTSIVRKCTLLITRIYMHI